MPVLSLLTAVVLLISIPTLYLLSLHAISPNLPSFFVDASPPSQSPLHGALSQLFNVTVSLLMFLIELYLFLLIGILLSTVIGFFFKAALSCTILTIVVVIPLLLLRLLTTHFLGLHGDSISEYIPQSILKNQNASPATIVSGLLFLAWLGGLWTLNIVFNPYSQISTGNIKVTSTTPFLTKVVVLLSLVGVILMASISSFNLVLVLYRVLPQQQEIGVKRQSLLTQNLHLLTRSYDAVLLQLNQRERRRRALQGNDPYIMRAINELDAQIESYKSYLLVLSSSINQTERRLAGSESSTSLFFDILQKDFRKPQAALLRLMAVYCIYRYLSLVAKIPLCFSTAEPSSGSLATSLSSYVQRAYYNQETVDEILVLLRVEIILSLCFFLTCFTGVLSTFNNLILITLKLSAEKGPYQSSPIPQIEVETALNQTPQRAPHVENLTRSTGSARKQYALSVLTPTRVGFSLPSLYTDTKESFDTDGVLGPPFQAGYSEVDLGRGMLRSRSFNEALYALAEKFDALAGRFDQARLISLCEKLLICELTALYVISMSLMIRASLLENSVNVVNSLYNSYELDPHYLDTIFEVFFGLSSVITVGILMFDKKRSLISQALSLDDGVLEVDEESMIQ